MKYKYQLHVHTSPCSGCARMSPEELVDGLVAGGYSGCVLTNHFFGGNSGIDRNLSWNDFVMQYEKDYKECKKFAKDKNLDILFGLEEHLFDGLEILCYGITPQFLYNNPQLHRNRTIEAWSDALHSFGALCIQAHPYRVRDYIKNPRLLPCEYIDGIEVFNVCNKPPENELAKEIADNYPEWILTAGSDAHHNISFAGGIKTSKPISTEKELADILKLKEYELLI